MLVCPITAPNFNVTELIKNGSDDLSSSDIAAILMNCADPLQVLSTYI